MIMKMSPITARTHTSYTFNRRIMQKVNYIFNLFPHLLCIRGVLCNLQGPILLYHAHVLQGELTTGRLYLYIMHMCYKAS